MIRAAYGLRHVPERLAVRLRGDLSLYSMEPLREIHTPWLVHTYWQAIG